MTPANSPGFVHLRTHSAYSLLEGALPIKKIAALAEADRQPAVAITDRNNLFGALEFSETMAEKGIQPIIGCTLSVSFPGVTLDAGPRRFGEEAPKLTASLALLAKDALGYANLLRLTSAAFLDSADAAPHVTHAALRECADGLICLSGGPEGPLDQMLHAGRAAQATEFARGLAAAFGDRFYVELQRHARDGKAVESALINLAYEADLPIVATNQAYFPYREDYDAHDSLLCVAEGRYIAEDDRRRLTHEHYFKTRAEMMALFADLPEALENTVEIARRCAFRPVTRAPILPRFTGEGADALAAEGADALAAEAEELRRQAAAGLEKRLAAGPLAPGKTAEDYRARLAFELDVIIRMKFPGYFLIVADFIQWAKAQGIPVGPGRGSGAGSVAAWALSITDLDPLRFGLLFERFLNPERVSMPDFDIDFCQDRRDEVIQYVVRKYGRDRVAQIITFGKLQARAVLRDVGRVLQMPYGQVNNLCKLVPNNPANPVTLAEAIAGEPKLQAARDGEPLVAQLLEIGQKLEGLYRHASTHAAGVVIGDRPLVELVPLYRDPRSEMLVTQFNMKWVEPAGLVKFDFLGLKTLTVLAKAEELIRASGRAIDLAKLELDDAATYELMSKGDTVGVFQLESTGMRESLRKLKPDRFEDIIAMVALYRPGPMDNIDPYINRKYGLETPDYLHPLIEPILKETYGVIIYQEQVMQIAQELSGYSLGEADLLRRAMGKKIKAEMDKQQARFVEGAVAKGVDKHRAAYIFELVAKFAGYGFNKSHAAAYALLAYHTAYLKANFPVEFLAATMTYDMANTDKLYMFAQEAKRREIAVKPPCVNHSSADFRPEGGAIRYGLAALKNMGRAAAEHVAAERGKAPFKSIGDFAGRIDARTLGKRGLETLVAAGAFDAVEPNRARIHANAESIMGHATRLADDKAAGQSSLFGGASAEPLKLRAAPAWGHLETLTQELGAVGFYLSGHPLDEHSEALSRINVMLWAEFEAKVKAQGSAEARLACTVTSHQERKSKAGNKFAFTGFSDPTGQFEAVVFSDTLAAAGDLLESGKAVILAAEGEVDGETVKTRVLAVQSLEKALGRETPGFEVLADASFSIEEFCKLLKKDGSNRIRLRLHLRDAGQEVELFLGGGFDLNPRSAGMLKSLPGVLDVARL
jgi:DNA polymerase-3 subunit alpha